MNTASPQPLPNFTSEHVITRRRLLDMGLPEQRFTQLKNQGTHRQIWRGAIISESVWEQLSRDQRAIAEHLAYAKTSTAPKIFTAESALLLQGYRLHNPPAQIHVTGQPRPQPHHQRVIGHRWAHPVPCDDVSLDVWACAQAIHPDYAGVDAILRLCPRDGTVIADQLLRHDFSREHLLEILRAAGGRTGRAKAETVLKLADAGAESPLESVARLTLLFADIPAPSTQVCVFTRSGPKYLDLAWEEEKLALEVDGKSKYFDFSPTEQVIYREHQRERELRAQGWEIQRTDAPEIYRRSDQLVTRVRAALRRRRGGGLTR